MLEVVVFFSGACLMALEIVGARIMAPHLGSSIIVWTSLIGMILGSLAVGNFIGGKLADRKPRFFALSFLLLLSALSVGLLFAFKEFALFLIAGKVTDIKVASVAAAFVLFCPPSLLLGTILPYATKLRLKSTLGAGSVIGRFYAISTVGALLGVYLTGFYFLLILGSNKLLALIAITLLVNSLVVFFYSFRKGEIRQKIFFFLLVFFSLTPLSYQTPQDASVVVDKDTAYDRVLITKQLNSDLRPTLGISAGKGALQSRIFLDRNDDLADEYKKYFRLAKHFNPELRKSLMIGGGVGVYTMDYLSTYQDASIDVVEIDPEVTKLGKEYFGLKDDPRLKTYYEDGRVFLNRISLTDRYDAVIIDSFQNELSVPFQLITLEATRKVYQTLGPNGVLIINTASSLEGKKHKALKAIVSTYKEVFPQVYIFPVSDKNDTDRYQNIVVVALKSTSKPTFTSQDKRLNSYLQNLYEGELGNGGFILTDDFAPIEQLELIHL